LLNVDLKDGKWSVEPEYEQSRLKIKFSDAVVKDGYIYAFDEAILSCTDYDTGDREWKKGRYGYGQVIGFEDHLLVQQEDPGALALVEMTPERFVEVATFPALAAKTWNNLAYANGRLFCRNSEEAVCFELKVTESSDQSPDEVAAGGA